MYHGERFNAWTRPIDAVTAYAGAAWLTVQTSLNGSPWKIAGIGVYGVTLTLFYSILTVYHSVRGRTKVVMHRLDHLSVYPLITGSYTPFCPVALCGPWGQTLFGTVWDLTMLGMLQEIKSRSEVRVLSVVVHAAMGWIVLIAVEPLLAALGSAGLTWLAVDGVLYTVGIVFYAYNHRFRRWRGIWYLLVIVGNLLHFVTI